MEKIKNTTSFSYLLVALLFSFLTQKAQKVDAGAYVKASFVEIGVDSAGGYEGLNITISPPLAGMHYRSGNPRFGFVANPLKDGWMDFNGDFFTPGSPENGWGIEIGDSGGDKANNNCSGDLRQIPGRIAGYSKILDCYNVDWEGDLVTATTDLNFKINYYMQENDLYYTTTVVIKNRTLSEIPLLYYHRNFDPDNNVSLTGNYTTTNTIENQAGGISDCDIACVSATQALPSPSYVALAGIGKDFRVSTGGFANRDASDIWNGSGAGLLSAESATRSADQAISLAYRIEHFMPGESRTFKFLVILNSADKTKAINNLAFLSYPNASYGPLKSPCESRIDTIKACGGCIPIEVNGLNTENYTWAWSPPDGLSTTVGYKTVACPTVTASYTLTGTPTSTCVTGVDFPFVIQYYPLVNSAAITDVKCYNDSTGKVIITSEDARTYSWTPSVSSSSVASHLPMGVYSCTMGTEFGCDIVKTFTITQPAPLVASITVTNTTCNYCDGAIDIIGSGGTGPDYLYTIAPTTSTTNLFSNLCAKDYTLTVKDENDCIQTYTTTILPSTGVTATISSSSYDIDQGEIITLSSGNGPNYLWLNTNFLNCSTCSVTTAQPTENSTYCVLITDNKGCKDTACAYINVEVPCSNRKGTVVPNVFSPNGDGVNDAFVLNIPRVDNIDLSVFDRWGLKLAEVHGTNKVTWDGKTKQGAPVTAGTYYYIINVSCLNNKEYDLKGTITVFK